MTRNARLFGAIRRIVAGASVVTLALAGCAGEVLGGGDTEEEPSAASCQDDGNPCTSDIKRRGKCTHPVLPDGTACPDGTCQAGACVPNPPVCPDDGNVCTSEAVYNGTCYHLPVPDGAACSAGSCQIGLCYDGCADTRVVEVSVASSGTTCARKADGSAWCFGHNGGGELGTGGYDYKTWQIENGHYYDGIPTRFDLQGIAELALGDHITFARRADGTLWFTGASRTGTPTQISEVGSDVAAIDVLGQSLGVVRADGTAWHLSFDSQGGMTVQQLPGLTDAVDLSWTGGSEWCALTTSGGVACWRRYYYTGTISAPTPLAGLTGVTKLSGPYALRSDGTLWKIASGVASQAFPDLGAVRDVFAKGDAACARKADDTLWCWGDNSMGELGLGSDPSVPEPRYYGTGYTAAAFSGTNGCTIRSDGRLFCAGLAGYERSVGPNVAPSVNNVNTPVEVPFACR